MKYKLFPLIIISVFTFLRCSSISVNYDYDESQDFSSYHTFKWLSKSKGKSTNAMRDPLARKKTKNAVIKTLIGKGFSEQKQGEPDFYVVVHSGVKNRIDVTHWGYHYGPWYGPNTSVYRYKEGTIFVDVIDGKRKELVWRGVGVGTIYPHYSPEERTEAIQEAIEMILEDFPPVSQ